MRGCHQKVIERRHAVATAMKLDAWTENDVADTARRKRLTLGYAIGAVTVGAALTFITYSAHGQAFTPEETIDVSLAKAPVMEKAPEPESTPPPEPAASAIPRSLVPGMLAASCLTTVRPICLSLIHISEPTRPY